MVTQNTMRKSDEKRSFFGKKICDCSWPKQIEYTEHITEFTP